MGYAPNEPVRLAFPLTRLSINIIPRSFITTKPNEPLDIWTQQLTPYNLFLVFSSTAELNEPLNMWTQLLTGIQIFPLLSQTSRLVWWMVTKEALHSVVRGGYRLRPTVDLFFYGKQKFNFHCFQKFRINLYCLKVLVALRSRCKTYKSLDKRF